MDKLGYEFPDGETLDTLLLRTLAIVQAYEACDNRCINFFNEIVTPISNGHFIGSLMNCEGDLKFTNKQGMIP